MPKGVYERKKKDAPEVGAKTGRRGRPRKAPLMGETKTNFRDLISSMKAERDKLDAAIRALEALV